MSRWVDLRTRVISGAILAAGALFITWWHPFSFDIMIIAMTAILWKEWCGLTRSRGNAFLFLGAAYIGAAAVSLIYLRHANLNILFSLFAIVWGGDIAAYFAGKQWGKHKIAPSISPGKSWEGLAASMIVSAGIAVWLGSVAPIPHAILGAALAVIGLMGDMFESSLKRKAGVKDSGTLIPGHGGLFDRVDALLPCAIFAAAALYIRLGMQ